MTDLHLINSLPLHRVSSVDLNTLEPLTANDKRVLASLQQLWFNHNRVPSYEQLSDYTKLPVEDIKTSFNKNAFLLSATQAGIPVSDEENLNPHVALSLVQVQVANALLNHMDRRTIRQKLAEFNVKSVTLKGWMAHKPFKDYINNRAGSDLTNLDWLTNTKLTELVEEGDLAAIKLAKELVGKLTQKVQVDVNLNLFLIRLVDIISARVSDPIIRELIAEDVEKLAMDFMPKGMGS